MINPIINSTTGQSTTANDRKNQFGRVRMQWAFNNDPLISEIMA